MSDMKKWLNLFESDATLTENFDDAGDAEIQACTTVDEVVQLMKRFIDQGVDSLWEVSEGDDDYLSEQIRTDEVYEFILQRLIEIMLMEAVTRRRSST
jgi:hypothetical protein